MSEINQEASGGDERHLMEGNKNQLSFTIPLNHWLNSGMQSFRNLLIRHWTFGSTFGTVNCHDLWDWLGS